jgi:hypothetical protein
LSEEEGEEEEMPRRWQWSGVGVKHDTVRFPGLAEKGRGEDGDLRMLACIGSNARLMVGVDGMVVSMVVVLVLLIVKGVAVMGSDDDREKLSKVKAEEDEEQEEEETAAVVATVVVAAVVVVVVMSLPIEAARITICGENVALLICGENALRRPVGCGEEEEMTKAEKEVGELVCKQSCDGDDVGDGEGGADRGGEWGRADPVK